MLEFYFLINLFFTRQIIKNANKQIWNVVLFALDAALGIKQIQE